VANAIDARTDLVPVTQIFREEGSELDTSLAEGLMAHLNAVLVEQFLHVWVIEGKAVVEPNSVLDDGHRKTVAVRLGVGHGGSAYPNPIKATQPRKLLYHE